MNKAAIIGTGQTKTKLKRKDVILPELMRESIDVALRDADMEIQEVDAILVGNSPDMLDGINHPEHWCTDMIGGKNLPVIRVHTGGTVGASVGIMGHYTVASGIFDTVIVVSGNKLSETPVQRGLTYVYHPTWGRDYAAGAISIVAGQARLYMDRYPHITERVLAEVGVLARKNALNNPYATLKLPTVNVEMLLNMAYLSTPLRLLDSCPISDGACAMVIENGHKAKKRSVPKSWIQAVSTIADGSNYPQRDWIKPLALEKAASTVYKKVGITNPIEQLDVVELYDAFTVQVLLWTEGMGIAEYGQAYKYIEDGTFSLKGKCPINPSGGVLSSNSIGASAMVRQVEIALQITRKAGDRQVEKADVGLAHGWGGAIQFHVNMIQSKHEDLVL